MSDGGRGRAALGLLLYKSSQKCGHRTVRRPLHRMVRWLAWLHLEISEPDISSQSYETEDTTGASSPRCPTICRRVAWLATRDNACSDWCRQEIRSASQPCAGQRTRANRLRNATQAAASREGFTI